MAHQLKTARITAASNASAWPTDEAELEHLLAEFMGLTLDTNYTGRQVALVDATAKMTDDVGWNKDPTTTVGSGEKVAGTAGESVVFGDLVYFKSDGKWWKTDADAVATAGPVRLALAMGTYAGDGAGVFLLRGFAELAGWSFTVGAAQYVSCTAGAMTPTPPSGAADIVRLVGYAHDATTLYFCPDTSWVEVV
jgi:hypothetical protein